MGGRVSRISATCGARSPMPQPVGCMLSIGHAVRVTRCALRIGPPWCPMPHMGDPGAFLTWGREVTGDLAAAERREWLCVNGVGGFASGTIAGTHTRRYHGLLVAALDPPLGRTLLAAAAHETVTYADQEYPLATARWLTGALDPTGYRLIERFRLDGTTPVWTYALADALLEKRVWMEPGANTTYVRWRLLRAAKPARLAVRVLVNYRDYHATTRAGTWLMDVTRAVGGGRGTAFDGARPLLVLAGGADVAPTHTWYRDFDLTRERERGLDHVDDHLHAATFEAQLPAGAELTLVISAEAEPSLHADAAWRRRADHEADILRR